MHLSVDGEVFACFPGMRIAVVVVNGLDNQTQRPDVHEQFALAWCQAGAAVWAHGNSQSHPRIKAWGEKMKAVGVSRKEYPSSIEALARRATKGGTPPTINPLVDFYNMVSLMHFVPVGGFDIDQITEGLEVRFSREGDTFSALDDNEVCSVPPGEISFVDGRRILTRHFVWRQSHIGLILPESKHVVLVSEVLGELGGGLCERILDALASGVKKHFGLDAETGILDVSNPNIALK